MGRARHRSVIARRIEGSSSARRVEELAVEEPLEIRLDGERVATTMRTPGHDFELAVGFLHGEGLLDDRPVTTVRYCATGPAVATAFNVVTVETVGGSSERARAAARLGATTSSCGFCGSNAIEGLLERFAPLPASPPFPAAVLAAMPDAVASKQVLFGRTGAVHAAAAFDRTGAVALVREDVGRHNAVDKVVGRLRLDGAVPARELGLFVSGRVSFELVQKAWAAGFGALVAVSAPTALAVEAASAGGLMLAAFARSGRLTLYVEPEPS